MEEFYTVKEVCRKLKVARETVRRWERDGWFPKRVRFSPHPRGRVGFSKTLVDTWMEARTAAATS
jgi:excisionase family DNA binding protein